MKVVLHFFLLFFLFLSCKQDGKSKSSIPITESIKTDKEDSLKLVVFDNNQAVDTLNCTDSNGLKQGVWRHFLKGRLWKIERYKDNSLHGKQIEFLANGEIIRNEFQNGVEHGYFLHYDPSLSYGSFVTYWENGSKVWSAFPWELESYIVPIKGFITEKEQVEIRVPYNSGKLMYQGTIEKHGKAIGIHKAFYESGEIKAVVDYDKDSIFTFSKVGKLIDSELIGNWRGRRMNSL